MKRIIIVFTVGLMFSLKGFCQIIDIKNDTYWIDAGVGSYYSTDKTDGFTWNLSVNMFVDSIFYKIKLNNNQEFQLWGIDPVEQSYSIGMLIGKGYSWKYFQISISCGLGIIGGVKRGNLLYKDIGQTWLDFNTEHYEKDKFFTPSIPLELDITLKPIKYLGAGVTVFCDLNLKRPMYGIIYKLGIGKIR